MEPKSKGFSPRELRALLWLLPVLAVVSWLVWAIARPGGIANAPQDSPPGSANYSDSLPAVLTDGSESNTHTPQASARQNDPAPSLFAFDPNTVEYHDLVRLGFTRGEALGIVKYRERGKVFEIPEDFAACYQVSEAMYLRLEPYIKIGEAFRLKPFRRNSGAGFRQNGADGAPTDAARENIVQGGEEARGVPVFHENTLIELNSADSAALISVRGIGAGTVVGIMRYRARLGGFAHIRQLAEVRGVTEQNYERIITQIFVDTLAIQKIDINFAPAKHLAAHPYIKAEALRKLLKQRQLKGGWSTTGELVEDQILTPGDAERLRPYLLFRPFSAPSMPE